MKRLIVFVCLFLLIAGCDTSTLIAPQGTTVLTADIVEVQTSDIPEDSGINDTIVPFYLPQKLTDGKDVQQPSLSKSGDRATISTDDTILVELYYTQETQGFPGLGKAEITTQGGNYTLKMRLNTKTACTLKSTGISKDEIIRIANSFYLETGPQVS